MLKIKKEIKLEELEKFGFEKLNDYYINMFEDDNSSWHIEEIKYIKKFGDGGRRGQTYYIYVSKNRSLNVNCTDPNGSGCETEVDDVLYDLIKADMVEKI